MARELEGFIVDEGEGTLTITKTRGVVPSKVGPAALFFLLCVAGVVATPIGLVESGEWQAMSAAQKALNVGVILSLLTMTVVFGRSLYLGLDRGFRVQASASGVSLRRHHFSQLTIPQGSITAVRVHGRTFQPVRQPRYCQVRIELGLRELDEPLELFAVGLGKDILRDSPEHRERLAKAGNELGDALAGSLGVPREWVEFPR